MGSSNNFQLLREYEELRKNTNVSESAAEIEPNGRTTLLLEDFQ